MDIADFITANELLKEQIKLSNELAQKQIESARAHTEKMYVAIEELMARLVGKTLYPLNKEWDTYIQQIGGLRDISPQEVVEQALREFVVDHDEFIVISEDARARLGMKPYVSLLESTKKHGTSKNTQSINSTLRCNSKKPSN